MGSPDRALVARLQRRDGSAFSQVYAEHGPRIFRFLARLCGRRELAEDLYQETWIKLAVHAEKLEEDTDLGAWLYTVARNLARSERRSEVARPRPAEVSFDIASGGASPYDWATANQTQGRLERGLRALPAPFREVLLLVVIEGIDHERAAAILGLTPEALRQRLARARAKLSEHVRDGTED